MLHTPRRSPSLRSPVWFAFAAMLAVAGTAVPAWADTLVARGVVFEDRNGNGERDDGEPGIEGVLVSNGTDVVRTDERGRYELEIDADDAAVFVIKPRDYQVIIDGQNLPRHYYIHKPAGSPDGNFRFPGVAPTGDLPESIDFPLVRSPESDEFTAIVLADTQPYNMDEVRYLSQDIIPDLIGLDAVLGVTLGDLVGDDLDLFEPLNEVQGMVGVPWYNVIGNHDLNFMSETDEHSDETYTRVYGPADFAFQYGRVHFISLNNVIWKGFDGYRNDGHPRTGNYEGGLRPRQLEFVRNLVEHIPEDDLIVVMTHIPLQGGGVHTTPQRRELFEILSGHPHTFSMSGHTHLQRQWFFGNEDGYTAGTEHHHFNAVTASGSWFRGAPDPFGLPHSTMRCGAPSGFALVHFDGNAYRIEYRASRRPASHQMHVYVPDEVPEDETAETQVVVNFYIGSPRCRVEVRVGDEESWRELEFTPMVDPYYARAKALEESLDLPGRPLPNARTSHHIWTGTLPEGLEAGHHTIRIRATDMFGQVHTSVWPVRVVE